MEEVVTVGAAATVAGAEVLAWQPARGVRARDFSFMRWEKGTTTSVKAALVESVAHTGARISVECDAGLHVSQMCASTACSAAVQVHEEDCKTPVMHILISPSIYLKYAAYLCRMPGRVNRPLDQLTVFS